MLTRFWSTSGLAQLGHQVTPSSMDHEYSFRIRFCLLELPLAQHCSKCWGAIILTVCTSMVSKPREIMSSIPSTMVLPLQDNGIPAGPNLTGNKPTPAGSSQWSPNDKTFPLSGQKTRKKAGFCLVMICDNSSMRCATSHHEQSD